MLKLNADELKSTVGGDAYIDVVPLDNAHPLENGTVSITWTDDSHHRAISLRYNTETRYLLSIHIAKSIAHYINNDWDTTDLINVLLNLANLQGIIVDK